MKTSYILAHIHTRYVRMIRPSNEKVNFYTYWHKYRRFKKNLFDPKKIGSRTAFFLACINPNPPGQTSRANEDDQGASHGLGPSTINQLGLTPLYGYLIARIHLRLSRIKNNNCASGPTPTLISTGPERKIRNHPWLACSKILLYNSVMGSRLACSKMLLHN